VKKTHSLETPTESQNAVKENKKKKRQGGIDDNPHRPGGADLVNRRKWKESNRRRQRGHRARVRPEHLEQPYSPSSAFSGGERNGGLERKKAGAWREGKRPAWIIELSPGYSISVPWITPLRIVSITAAASKTKVEQPATVDKDGSANASGERLSISMCKISGPAMGNRRFF